MVGQRQQPCSLAPAGWHLSWEIALHHSGSCSKPDVGLSAGTALPSHHSCLLAPLVPTPHRYRYTVKGKSLEGLTRDDVIDDRPAPNRGGGSGSSSRPQGPPSGDDSDGDGKMVMGLGNPFSNHNPNITNSLSPRCCCPQAARRCCAAAACPLLLLPLWCLTGVRWLGCRKRGLQLHHP